MASICDIFTNSDTSIGGTTLVSRVIGTPRTPGIRCAAVGVVAADRATVGVVADRIIAGADADPGVVVACAAPVVLIGGGAVLTVAVACAIAKPPPVAIIIIAVIKKRFNIGSSFCFFAILCSVIFYFTIRSQYIVYRLLR